PVPTLLNQYGAAGYAAGCADASRYYAQLLFPTPLTPQQPMAGVGFTHFRFPFGAAPPTPMSTPSLSFDQMMAGLAKTNQAPQTVKSFQQQKQQPSTSEINNKAGR
ncbi:unnamed protein product, partial [Mesorhabditis belari]